jgi:hypothetical protein
MDVKTSFFYVSSEVQKDLQDISAGIDQFFNTQLIKILSGIWQQSWQDQLELVLMQRSIDG